MPATSRWRSRKRAQVLARAVDVAGGGLGGDAKQPIGGAAERRHDDDRPAPVGALRLHGDLPRGADDADHDRSIAARSATDVPPNFMTIIGKGPWRWEERCRWKKTCPESDDRSRVQGTN